MNDTSQNAVELTVAERIKNLERQATGARVIVSMTIAQIENSKSISPELMLELKDFSERE
jgi:hypothetical protein